MRPRKANIWERIDFTPSQHRVLKMISKNLRITIAGVVESTLDHRLVPFARGVVFFKQRIEVSPGSRLACEDVWAAFQEWCSSHRFRGQISADDFAAMCHQICYFKDIAVRARGNQVFCIDVRLRA
jgi:hypothetical protein